MSFLQIHDLTFFDRIWCIGVFPSACLGSNRTFLGNGIIWWLQHDLGNCEACTEYLMSIFGMTTDEKVLLKSVTFLCKCPWHLWSSYHLCYIECVVVCYCRMCHFFAVELFFSGVNSGKDINFCSKCGISSGDTLSRDSLDSSVCVTGKVLSVS